jgi:hypothetical protein
MLRIFLRPQGALLEFDLAFRKMGNFGRWPRVSPFSMPREQYSVHEANTVLVFAGAEIPDENGICCFGAAR